MNRMAMAFIAEIDGCCVYIEPVGRHDLIAPPLHDTHLGRRLPRKTCESRRCEWGVQTIWLLNKCCR